MELKGNIKRIFDTVVVSDKFKKRELVLTTLEDKYPQDILIQFNQDNENLLEGFVPGETVVVKFNLKGREWINPKGEIKYFNTIEGWSIQIEKTAEKKESKQEVNNDLPF